MKDKPHKANVSNRISRRQVLKIAGAVLSLTPLRFMLRRSTASAGEVSKRIYIAPDDHTDYFWSGDEDTYRQAFLEMMEYYLDQADATANEPSEYQSRWNCDGSYWIWTYEKNKPAAAFQRLMSRVHDGHISFPLNALVVCLGGAPAEAVLRGMYYAGTLERRFNLKVPLAISMENQTLPCGLGALWAGSGAKYSWKGICQCDTLVHTAWDREHEIYWMRGLDGSRILMKWNSMLKGNQNIGGYAEARNPGGVVEYVDKNPGFIARYSYRVIGAFGKGWDDLKTLTDEFVTTAKNKTNSSRKVIVSNEQDFFEDFEVIYGSSIPEQSCSFGNEWDLYCAALAEVSARVKRAVESLRSAEALATLATLRDSKFMERRREARDLAWMDLGLFWEHNFGMVNPQTGSKGVEKRIAWQRRLADEVESYVNALLSDAADSLARMIERKGNYPRLYAFNPLSWTRTDVAEVACVETGPVHVIDLSNGSDVPAQIVRAQGERRVRILAREVPPVGYKVYEIRPGAGASFPDEARASGNVLENEFYRITVSDLGAIVSLIDKRRGNYELVKKVNNRFMNDLGPGYGTVAVEEFGPVSTTLTCSSSTPVAHTSRITLVRESRRIEIRNEINQNFSGTHTWGFGFNLAQPDVWHEEVGAILRAKLLTQGGHYSPRNARFDWLTLNHFADMTDGSGALGITLSNADCYFMKLGNSTTSTLDVSTPIISVLAGGRVVNGNNGLPDQGDDSYFLQRFALQTHDRYHQASAMRFALEHQNPLVTRMIAGGREYPENGYSFLSISDPRVLLWALKPSDDGPADTIILRLWNIAPEPVSCAVRLQGWSIVNAKHVRHIETPIGAAEVVGNALQASFAPQQIKTFSLTIRK